MSYREWREEEDRRANKRSMRRAIVAVVLILTVSYFLFSANLPHH